MTSPRIAVARTVSVVALAGLCAAVAVGCGNELPSNAVAQVGNTVVTKQQFDTWFEQSASGQAQSGMPVPDPPAYEKCVAALRKAQPKPTEDQPQASDADLKTQCKASYEQLRQQVMQFLIQSQWIEQEAGEQDLEVSGQEVRDAFEEQKKQAFPKEKDYKKFLKESGSTEQDILFRVRLTLLQDKLTKKIQENQEEVSDEDVKEYYEKNKKQFAQPERRDLNLVLAKTKKRAEQAKSELEGGAKFAAVAKKYSIDEGSKANGGKYPDMAKGTVEGELDEAVFGARKGGFVGPVKTQFGWYVFEVTAIKPGSQQSLKDVEETVRGQLKAEREQKAMQDFVESFREEYKEKTDCREEYVIAECKNAPKEETETGPASGGAPGAPSSPSTPQPQPQPQQPQPQPAPSP